MANVRSGHTVFHETTMCLPSCYCHCHPVAPAIEVTGCKGCPQQPKGAPRHSTFSITKEFTLSPRWHSAVRVPVQMWLGLPSLTKVLDYLLLKRLAVSHEIEPEANLRQALWSRLLDPDSEAPALDHLRGPGSLLWGWVLSQDMPSERITQVHWYELRPGYTLWWK